MSELNDLVSALGDLSPSSSVRFRQGEITAVGLNTVSVDIGGSGVSVDDIPCFASYSPTVGDVVWLTTDGEDWFVLGKLGPGFTVDGLSIRGVDGQALTGSKLTLESGVSKPPSSPVASVTWPNKSTGWFSNRGYNPRGWFYDSGYWYSTETLFGGGWKRYTEGTEYFSKVNAYALPSNQNPLGGIAVISGKAYVLVKDDTRLWGYYPRWYVYRYDVSTGAKEAEWEYKPSTTNPVEVYGYWPGIGVKGTNLIIAQARQSDNKIEIREFTTTGTVVGSTIVTTVAAGQPIHSIMYGSFDFGAARFVVYADTWTEVKVLSVLGGYVANESFPTPLKENDIDGIGWDSTDGTFVATRAETIYRHSKHAWTTASDGTWWIAHSWFDSSTAGTGQHETLIGTPVSFPMTKRAALVVESPALPAASVPPSDDDVTGVRFYHGRGATQPTAANMKREITDVADGVTKVTYTNLTPVTAANTGTPPAFPDQTPAEIVSSGGELVLRGNGELESKGVVWLNAAGTGRLQTPVLLVADRNATAASTTGGFTFNTTHHDIVVNQGGFTRTSVSSVARYIVPMPGVYRVQYRQGFAANSTGRRVLDINCGTASIGWVSLQATSTGTWSATSFATVRVTDPATQYFTFDVSHSVSGTSISISANASSGQIVIERISD